MGERPRIGIIGAGRVGRTIGHILKQHGYPIAGVSNRTTTAVAAALLETEGFDDPRRLAPLCDVLLIAVPDDQIAAVAAAIATDVGKATVAFHVSGALSSDILAPLRHGKAAVASLHPVRSFAEFRPLKDLSGTICTLEGDPAALPLLRQIVADLGGRPVEIATESKALYHAAAAIASNYLVTLYALAEEVMNAAGLPAETAREALLPLMQGTLENLKASDPVSALTGPIARGDVQTIRTHLAALADWPEHVELYRALGKKTAGIALRKGQVPPDRIRRIIDILEEPGRKE